MASPERIFLTPNSTEQEKEPLPKAANDNEPLLSAEELALKTANDNQVLEIPPRTQEEEETLEVVKQRLHTVQEEVLPNTSEVLATNTPESVEDSTLTIETSKAETSESGDSHSPATASGGEGKGEKTSEDTKTTGGGGSTSGKSSGSHGGEKKKGLVGKVFGGILFLIVAAATIVAVAAATIVAVAMKPVIKLSDMILTKLGATKGGGGGGAPKKPSGGGGH